MNNIEMMKVFDFILNNLSNNEILNINTLIEIRNSINNNKSFELRESEIKALKDIFKSNKSYFDRNTPSIFLDDEMCCNIAILNDINSVNFAKVIPFTNEEIISRALKEKFILNYSSPLFLKRNLNVIKESIKRNSTSINYIDSNKIVGQINDLLDIIRNSDYTLSKGSPKFLTEDKIVVLNSIKRNIKTAKYMSNKFRADKDIIKYLYLHDYYNHILKSEISNLPLNLTLDKDILNKYLNENHNLDESDISKYINIFLNAFDNIKIETFKEIFSTFIEKSWVEYRNENSKYYNNIFSKITSELRNSKDFELSIKKFRFIGKMKETLADKYYELENAMKNYFNIYNSDIIKKEQESIDFKNTISNLSAQYIAKIKEKYKSKMLNLYMGDLSLLFIPNIANKEVLKKVMLKAQKEKFYQLYMQNDKNIINKLNYIKCKYKEDCNIQLIDEMIFQFINNSNKNIESIVRKPERYDEYKKYKKANKLVSRLNRKYIKYDDVEVESYKDIIKYDNVSNKYYVNLNFSFDEIKLFNEYINKEQLFQNIKREISSIISSMKIKNIKERIICDYKFKFNDNYYIFDKERFLKTIKLENINELCNMSLSNESYSILYDFLVNKGMLIIYLLCKTKEDLFILNDIDAKQIKEIISNISKIEKLSKIFNFDTTNIGELLKLNMLIKIDDIETVSVLGYDIINKLSNHYNYNERKLNELLRKAKELVAKMSLRINSTIPNIEGTTEYYSYNLYSNQDRSILTSGIDTDSCFKIDGVDNDFLHYCAINKNGFVIKIKDKHDNFIARASGIRNGNCIFINQLRTIYDKRDNKIINIYEKQDIINVFYKACNEFIIKSKLSNESVKIDFVFATASYLLRDESFIDDKLKNKIIYNLLDTNSDDYINYISKTKNLDDVDALGFDTDYGFYEIVCIAKSKELKLDNLYLNDVPAQYNRFRNKVIITSKISKEILDKLNKIAGLYSYINGEQFKYVNITRTSTVYVGDNWYIITDHNDIIDYRVINDDVYALKEFNEVLKSFYTENKKRTNNYKNLVIS